MFFKNLRSIVYDFGKVGKKRVRDLSAHFYGEFTRTDDPRDSPMVRQDAVRTGERPEVFSDRLMGHVRFWWIPMILSNAIGFMRGWPLSNKTLHNTIRRSGSLDDVVLRRRTDGVIEDPRVPVFLIDSETGKEIAHFVRGTDGLGARHGNYYLGRATQVTTRIQKAIEANNAAMTKSYVKPGDIGMIEAQFLELARK